jgi:hypothetical protein
VVKWQYEITQEVLMARPKKEGATKRTYRLPDELVESVTAIAQSEKRTTTAQIEVFLSEQVRIYKGNKHAPINAAPSESAP